MLEDNLQTARLANLVVLTACDSMQHCKITDCFQIVNMEAAWTMSEVLKRSTIDNIFSGKNKSFT